MMNRFTIPAVLLLLGCFAANAQDAAYKVKPGDTLAISVWKEPTLQGPVLVRPDGAFTFPLVGEVNAREKSVSQLQATIVEQLKKFISDPIVTISVQEVKGNKIYVIGQVAKPGEFIMNPEVDVLQALSMAGGATPFAALGDIRVLRRTGASQSAFPFDYSAVIRGRKLEQNIRLQSGDVVIVP